MVVVNGVPTRTGRKDNDKGKLVRYAKKSGEVIK
jgi:large subunit ribosomal protein L24